MHHSKRYNQGKTKVEPTKLYALADAITLIKEVPVKFDATVELHVRLGIDPKKSEQTVRGSVQLPHGTGKTKKVIAFVSSNYEADAKAAGADIIGTAEVIAVIKQTGKIEFDIAIATPDMMKPLAVIARTLGQKGLMPNPKTETVGTDVKKMITAIKAGKVNFKNDDTGNLHLSVGKVSFSNEQLQTNTIAAIEAVRKARPSSAKGTFIRRLVLSSTMGPGVLLTTTDHVS